MGQLREVVRVRDNERAAFEGEHVEFDHVDAELGGGPERVECVLGRDRRGTTVRDDERATFPAEEVDQ